MSAATLPVLLSAFLLASAALIPRPALADTHTDCGVAQTAFSFCVSYIAGIDKSMSPKCCQGARSLQDLAPTPADQRTACGCLKQMLATAGVADDGMPKRAKDVMAKCGVKTRAIPTSLSQSCDE